MYKICSSDCIYAMVTRGSEMLCNIRLSGLSCWNDLHAAVRSQLPGYAGMTSVSVRNVGQGWSTTASMVL